MTAWNPSPEVAVARDAAKAFDADMCVVIFVNAKKERMGYASYGANPALCAETKKMADRCYEAAKKWFEDQ